MFSERKWFFVTIIIFIEFVSASIWKWHSLFMYSIYGIEEIDTSQENICYIFVFKDKQQHNKNSLIVCLLLKRGLTMTWIPFIIICYSPFLWTFIYLMRFHSFSMFKSLFLLVRVMLLHTFIKLNVWLILIHVWCLTFLCDVWILCWLISCLLQIFHICRDDLF